MLLASMALVACKKETDFTVENPTAWVGEPVKVKDNNEKYKKNTVVVYDFGDGSQSNEIGDWSRVSQINPTHTYEKAGVYTITQQVMKTGNIQKRSGKTYVGSATVTIQTVAPTMELSVASPSTGQAVVIKNTTDESANKGYNVDYQLVIQGPTWIEVDSWNSNTNSFSWTPQTSGAYKVTLYAYQGESKTMISSDVTVTGSNAYNLSEMLNGKWSVATSASLTGSAYAAFPGCGAAGTLSARLSSISVNNDGNIYSAIWANQGGSNSTAIAGNVLGGQGSFTVIDETHVRVSADFFVNTSITSSNQMGEDNDRVYVVKSASATSIVLERVEKDSNDCDGDGTTADLSYTDTYTITLTK